MINERNIFFKLQSLFSLLLIIIIIHESYTFHLVYVILSSPYIVIIIALVTGVNMGRLAHSRNHHVFKIVMMVVLYCRKVIYCFYWSVKLLTTTNKCCCSFRPIGSSCLSSPILLVKLWGLR